MNLFATSGLLIGFTSFIFGFFVLYKSPRSKVNFLWTLFVVAIGIWGFGGYKIGITTNVSKAFFWWRITHIGVIFIPIFLFHFVYEFLKIKRKKIIFIVYLIGIFFLIINFFTNWFIVNMRWVFDSFYWDSPPGFFYYFFIIFFFSLIAYSGYKLFITLKDSSGIQHGQIKYFLIALIIGFSGGGFCFLPCFNIKLYPIFNFTVIFYPIIMAYAILRYRFMDIKFAIKRGAVFSGLVIATTAMYVLFTFLIGWTVFGGTYTLKAQLLTGLIVSIATAAGFQPLYERLKKATDKYLFKGDYKPQKLLADISDVLSHTLELDKIITTLKTKTIKALRIDKFSVFIFDEKTKKLLGNKKKKEAIAFNKIIDCLRTRKDVLVLEELKRKYADKVEFNGSFSLIKNIEQIKTNLIVPLYIKNKLIGLFLIGNKKSGDMFSVEDIRTLETIASQAAIAIENARLYKDMKDFSATLQKEVDRQTKKLRTANKRLKELDKAKSEFISLASHQLRTPLTAIKGYISMILEGMWGKLDIEQEEKLKRVFISTERLINLVEDLLMVSRIESGRLEFNYQKVSLEPIIESLAREFEHTIKINGLYLNFKKPDKPLSMISADQLKIRQVFQNLIDNAIHYTKKGGITISVKEANKKIIISVQDTGIGISVKEYPLLFKKFSRAAGAVKMFTDGTGLGLYLCAKIVKGHKGRVWAESEGKGKGSTFFVELPVGK